MADSASLAAAPLRRLAPHCCLFLSALHLATARGGWNDLFFSEMAEPVGLASGLITLVGFTLQCSKSLYQAVGSFQSHQRTIRDLRDELQSLNGVLQSLLEVADSPNTSLSSLKLPLLRCGKACKDFEDVIARCAGRSESRTSFRDWAKLRYMGDGVESFRHMLAGYKSTIAIALGDANM